MSLNRAVAWWIALLAALAIASRASADRLPVYADSLAPGWQNWSWSTMVNFANASPAYGGSGASISVSYTAAWAGLYLHNDSPVSTSSYTSVRFQIHGGASGGHQVRIVGYN